MQYNLTNGWSAPKRWPIDDGQGTPNALTTGDLNGDKRTDLILLGENNLYFLAQNVDHTLAEPQKIPFSGAVRAVQALDIDGDGRDDLLLINWDSPNPFRFPFARGRRTIGAGDLFPAAAHSRVSGRRSGRGPQDGDRDHRAEFRARAGVRIFAQAGRGNFRRVQGRAIQRGAVESQFVGIAARILWADLNGDGPDGFARGGAGQRANDAVSAKGDGTYAAAKTFATLTGVSELAAADWNGDGHIEIFVLSGSDAERQVGVTRLDENGRIAFPTILPLDGTPKTMAVGKLRPGGQPHAGGGLRAGHQSGVDDHHGRS